MKTELDGKKLEVVKRRLGYEDCLTVNLLGRKGELAMLWRKESMVEIVSYSHRHIAVWVEDAKYDQKWLFIGLHGEPNMSKC